MLPWPRLRFRPALLLGEHKRHRVNVQVLADPAGRPVRAGPALPGPTHDLTAARRHGVIARLVPVGVQVLARSWPTAACQGAHGTVRIPVRGWRLSARPAGEGPDPP